ncbi:helix-turn-helix domain-containing protein [Clostridioides difficile]
MKNFGIKKEPRIDTRRTGRVLFVSRTAISKWESRRGYPSIDSLKEISRYFVVSIDDLLSGEQLITIAEKENKPISILYATYWGLLTYFL